jgi:hypothetical protein
LSETPGVFLTGSSGDLAPAFVGNILTGTGKMVPPVTLNPILKMGFSNELSIGLPEFAKTQVLFRDLL